MARLVALLRGINVSGQKKIRMAELRERLAAHGFEDVTTYLQSGNVVFDAGRRSASACAALIESAIQRDFGFDVATLTRSKAQLAKLVREQPFSKADTKALCVTFLEKMPAASNRKALSKPPNTRDEFMLSGQHVYAHYLDGIARSKLTNNFFERRLDVRATSRNWRTVNQLLEMLSS